MPDWSRHVRRNLPPLGLRPEREAEIAAELIAQFEQAHQEALAEGLSEAEAEERARSHVADWNALAAEIREAERAALPPLAPESRGGTWRAGLLHDVRYALRTLRRNPVFAAVAALTLAFGIGGNTAIFTVVDHLALRGLPYPESSRLVDLEHTKTDQPEVEPWCSIDNFADFRKRAQSFESLAGVSPVWNLILSGGGEMERVEALYVSADFFPMLRVRPAIGRLFTPAEDNRGRPANVVLLSHGFWMRRFGGSPGALGATVQVDSTTATVIGVLPADFVWRGEPLAGTASRIDLWMPLASNPLAGSPRTLRFLKVTGRLKPGVTLEQARDEIGRVGAALTAEFPDANRNLRFAGQPLEPKITGRLRPAVYLLIGTVGFVLLMASANVANLLLARAAARGREIAVRIALGASPARLLRQLLVESATLAAAGGVLAILLALAFLRLILAYGPPALVKAVPIALDLRALGFTAAVATATALLAGIVPAWRAIAGAVAAPLREGRGSAGGNRGARSALAVAQIAIALTLLIGAGLLIRSFLRVLAIDPGFDGRHIVSISTQLPPGLNAAQRNAAYNTIRDRLLATPGVESVAAVSRMPLLGMNLTSLFIVEGQDHHGHPPEVEFRAATNSYFRTMRIPLKSGRLFDDRFPPRVLELLIDEAAARRYFPGVDPLGKRIRFLADSQGPWYTIVGVVGAIRHFGLEAEPRPTLYRPTGLNPLGAPIFVIRTAGDAAAQTRGLARTLSGAYGNLPAYNVLTMEQLIDRSTSERRFLMWLLTSFAVAAILLAGIGIYGAMSQSVAQRRREIGVRIALGAAPADALRLVFREGLGIAFGGVGLGVLLGWAGALLGQKLLFGVRPADLPVFGAAALLLLGFAAAGCWIPARRATRVDPLITLRDS
jgi:predicted permease